MQEPPDQIRIAFGKDDAERLVPVAHFRKRKDLSPEDYLALETAEGHRANYVFFRHNADGPLQSRFPHAYVYDYSEEPLFASGERHELAELHKELWNACPVPLFMVFLPNEVQIFSSLKPPTLSGEVVQSAPLEVIELGAKVQRGIDLLRARLRELDIGTFWDSSTNTYLRGAKRENSVYGLMLQQLRDTRKTLIREGKIDQTHANRLLVMALLVRYLEERTDSKGRGVFPKAGETRNGKEYPTGFFEKFSPGAADFTSMVRKQGNTLMTIEAKRLPSPPPKHREREYVVGGEKQNGGVERFKLGLHGLRSAARTMLGYVQEHDCLSWRARINEWLAELSSNGTPKGFWGSDERLELMSQKSTTMRCRSEHQRRCGEVSDRVEIVHIWALIN